MSKKQNIYPVNNKNKKSSQFDPERDMPEAQFVGDYENTLKNMHTMAGMVEFDLEGRVMFFSACAYDQHRVN